MAKGVALETVAKLADALPDTTVGARWGMRTWMVRGNGFAWERPLGKADLARYGGATPPTGDLVAFITDGLDAKDALLDMGLPGFFTIPHFNGYAAVLVELRLARLADVRAVLEVAHRIAATKPAKKPKKAKPKAKR